MSQVEKMQEWNRLYPVGTSVRLQAAGGEVQITTTRCEARLSPDRKAVVWVKNQIGPQFLDDLRVVSGDEPAPPPRAQSIPASWSPSKTLRFEVLADPVTADAWRVEAIDRNGSEQFYLAVFRGPSAEARAREYADWKNQGSR